MRRIYFEIDRLSVDSLVAPCYPRRLIFNFPLDRGEVSKFLTTQMAKFGPFTLTSDAGGSVRNVYVVILWPVVPFAWDIDELKDKGPPGDDSTSPR